MILQGWWPQPRIARLAHTSAESAAGECLAGKAPSAPATYLDVSLKVLRALLEPEHERPAALPPPVPHQAAVADADHGPPGDSSGSRGRGAPARSLGLLGAALLRLAGRQARHTDSWARAPWERTFRRPTSCLAW